MKIALCQVNPTVGALETNKALILNHYVEAVENGVDLVVFPEMVITGYPIADITQYQWNCSLTDNTV